MENSLFYITIKALSERVNQSEESEFLKTYLTWPFDKLHNKLAFATDVELKNLVAVIMLEKLGIDEVDQNNIGLFKPIYEVISKDEYLKTSCYSYLDSYLRMHILETTSIEDLCKLAKIAVRVKEFDSELEEAFISIENQAASLSSNILYEIMDNHEEKPLMIGAKCLKKLSNLSYDMESTAEVIIHGAVEFIQERNNFRNENLNMERNVQNDYKIINDLLETKISDPYKNILIEIKEKLSLIEPEVPEINSKNEARKIYNRPVNFEVFELNHQELKIDMKLMKKNNKLNKRNFENFTVVETEGLYDKIPAIIREYSLNCPDASRKREIQDKISIEAKCIKYLSERKQVSILNNLKFYYEIIDQNTFHLVQVFFKAKRLSLFRNTLKNTINQELLISIVQNIINAFNELENLNIFHQNISLDSILFDDYKITIIDFYYAVLTKTSYRLEISEDQKRQLYYWPDMVEKSTNQPGKMDRFALGLVILQLADHNLTDISHRPNIYSSLDNLSIGWLKELLNKMINLDFDENYSFKNLDTKMQEISATHSSISRVNQSVLDTE